MTKILSKENGPILIAGPCSAESQEQLVEVAKELKTVGADVIRAGIWKPRTRPGAYEGPGKEGLKWLISAKKETGLKVATEVANVKHVYEALKSGVDILWIGARTTSNPFAVQEIAEALEGVDVPVLVKNPVNPDVDLWLGAVERLERVGVKEVGLVHRGVSYFGDGLYRNKPEWQIPIELMKRRPDLLMINDPSHIAGKRHLVQQIIEKALALDFDGLMVEVHPNPQVALSDSKQQIKPAELKRIMDQVILNKRGEVSDSLTLDELRQKINLVDDELLDLLEARMKVSIEIGGYKKKNGIKVLQQARWSGLLEKMVEKGSEKSLSPNFVERLYKNIHDESINQQMKVLQEEDLLV